MQATQEAQKELDIKMESERKFKSPKADLPGASVSKHTSTGPSKHEEAALRQVARARTREVNFKKAAESALRQTATSDAKHIAEDMKAERGHKASEQARKMELQERKISQLKSKMKQQNRELNLARDNIEKLNTTSSGNIQKLKDQQDEFRRLKQLPKDCRVTSWSSYSACNAKCGPGKQHRSRVVLRNATNGGSKCPDLKDERKCQIKPCQICGDGKLTGEEQCDDGNTKPTDGCDQFCRVEPGFICTAGASTTPSVCEYCGDGITRGSEECDDGNSKNGDGCSDKCKLEKGHVCTTIHGKTRCKKADEFSTVINTVKTQMLGCNSKPEPMAFVLDSVWNGTGHCIRMPSPAQLEDEDIGVFNWTQHGLGNDPSAVSILSTVVSPPTDVDSIRDTQGLTGARPYALCQTNLVKLCITEAISRKSSRRSCTVHGNGMCREVILQDKYCDTEDAKSYGGKRAVRKLNDPRGETVCVFPGCRTPPSWLSREGGSIQPKAWCMFPTINSVP
jgi:cysteine-rich repeat protein